MKILINDSKIDWDSQESHYFFNEKHPQSQKLKEIASRLPFFPSSVYLFTSSFQKICILKKQAFLTSAKAVNQHLECSSKDKWNINLPLFHVGGLSILARSYLGSYSYQKSDYPWDPKKWLKEITDQKITIASLVPAQVYDLVKLNLQAPKHLRAVVVGGDNLSFDLYKKARHLLWPLLPSYGMTEACSQVATAQLKSLEKNEQPLLKKLNHIEFSSTEQDTKIKSACLLESYFDIKTETLIDPKNDEGWFLLEDKVTFSGDYLSVKGRKDDQIKIKGELVDLQNLRDQIKNLSFHLTKDYEILPNVEKRNSYEICLVTNSFDFKEISSVLENFNNQVLPYEQIQKVYCLNTIHKTDLLKVKLEELRKQIF